MSESSHSPEPHDDPHSQVPVHHDHKHTPEEIRAHVRFYLGIFGALLLLTFLTVGVAQIHIGPPDSNVPNIVVGLLIAAVKATLVAAFFMHLSTEKKLIFRVLIFTAAFVLALMFLTLLAFFDPIQIKP